MPIDFSKYECSFCDEENNEFHAISINEKDVVIIPLLKVVDGKLVCEYKSFDPALSDDDIKGLVYVCLLGKFMRRFYVGKVKFVKFKDLSTGQESESVYIG